MIGPPCLAAPPHEWAVAGALSLAPPPLLVPSPSAAMPLGGRRVASIRLTRGAPAAAAVAAATAVAASAAAAGQLASTETA